MDPSTVEAKLLTIQESLKVLQAPPAAASLGQDYVAFGSKIWSDESKENWTLSNNTLLSELEAQFKESDSEPYKALALKHELLLQEHEALKAKHQALLKDGTVEWSNYVTLKIQNKELHCKLETLTEELRKRPPRSAIEEAKAKIKDLERLITSSPQPSRRTYSHSRLPSSRKLPSEGPTNLQNFVRKLDALLMKVTGRGRPCSGPSQLFREVSTLVQEHLLVAYRSKHVKRATKS